MTQRQQYAVVPKPLLDKLIYAIEQESMAYADPIAHVDEAAAALEEWQAAPPPPDQVLSLQQRKEFTRRMTFISNANRDEQMGLVEEIERAVLKQLGAKNV